MIEIKVLLLSWLIILFFFIFGMLWIFRGFLGLFIMVIIILYFDVGGVIIIGLDFWVIKFEELRVENEGCSLVEIRLLCNFCFCK